MLGLGQSTQPEAGWRHGKCICVLPDGACALSRNWLQDSPSRLMGGLGQHGRQARSLSAIGLSVRQVQACSAVHTCPA